MMELDSDSLDMLARATHVDVSGAKTKAVKVRLIEKAGQASAHVSVLGMDIEVTRSATRSVEVQRIMREDYPTDDETDRLLELLVGKGQRDAIVERCRNEDGTVDVDAYAVAIVSVLQDETVKNWLLSRG